MGGLIQNEDFKTEAELLAAGGSKTQLLNETKIYVSHAQIQETLDDAIETNKLHTMKDITTPAAPGAGYRILYPKADGLIHYEGSDAVEKTLVEKDASQALTNKTIVAGSNTISGLLHGTHVDNPSSGVHGVVGSVVGTSDIQTLTNKKLSDSTTEIVDVADVTKKIKFDAANSASTTLTLQSSNTADRTIVFPDLAGTIALTGAIQTLTNKTFDDSLLVKEISSPATPASGYIRVFPKTDHNWYSLDSTGLETPLGSGSGEYNFLKDKVLADWTSFDDYTNVGAGGSATGLTIANSPSPITNEIGKKNFRFSKDAVNRLSKGKALAFTTRGDIDKGAVRTLRVQATESANYVDNDVSFVLRDVTNDRLIFPANQSLYASSLVANSQYDFQLSSDSTSFQLLMYCSSSSALAYDIDFVAGIFESKKVTGPVNTDGKIFTPTFSAAFGTVTNATGLWKKLGDFLWLRGSCTTGTMAASIASVTVPFNLSIDVDKTIINNNTSNGGPFVGTYNSGYNSPGFIGSVVTATATSETQIYFGYKDADSLRHLTPCNGTDLTSNGMVFSFECLIPIKGWSSNQVLSEEISQKRVFANIALVGSAQTISSTASTAIQFDTVIEDTLGGWDAVNFRYEIKENGDYDIKTSAYVTGETALDNTNLTIVAGTQAIEHYYPFASTIGSFHTSRTFKLLKGEFVYVTIDSAADASYQVGNSSLRTFLTISKVGTSQQVVYDTMPTGTILPFAGSTVPIGYLLCNGAAISRNTYSDLFSKIGVTHGYGDNSTTFNIPDYRGRFLRGVDGATGRDPDRASRTAMATGGSTGDSIGSLQGHAFQTHTHTQDAHAHKIFDNASYGMSVFYPTYQNTATTGFSTTAVSGLTDAGVSSVTATNQNATASGTHAQATANETRPVNANVNYIIKY